MPVIFQTSYSLPAADYPLTHARIAHAGNWLAGGTVTASDTDADYFEDGPTNSLTYEKWKPDTLPATWEYDHGSAAEVDYCCIGAHTLGTNGNTLQVQYWNGTGWSGIIPATAITTDQPIMAIFAPQTRQRWRIQVSGGTAPTIGVIRFGKAMQMPQAIYGGHTPIDMARQTTMRANMSASGEFLGRTVQRTSLGSSYDWQHLRADWVRSTWRPFQIALEQDPIFLAWRPATFSEVVYGWTGENPTPTNMGVRDLMSVSLSLTGRGYD